MRFQFGGVLREGLELPTLGQQGTSRNQYLQNEGAPKHKYQKFVCGPAKRRRSKPTSFSSEHNEKAPNTSTSTVRTSN